MDRVELTIADVERLIEWRGLHPAEVRSHPAPLKAVEIHIKENGWCIKGVREGDKLRLYLRRTGSEWATVSSFGELMGCGCP